MFRPLKNNDLILGAVGILQFDVVAHRLRAEYGVDCRFESVAVATARWVECSDEKTVQRFRDKAFDYLAEDQGGALVYIAPTRINLDLAIEKWPGGSAWAVGWWRLRDSNPGHADYDSAALTS